MGSSEIAWSIFEFFLWMLLVLAVAIWWGIRQDGDD